MQTDADGTPRTSGRSLMIAIYFVAGAGLTIAALSEGSHGQGLVYAILSGSLLIGVAILSLGPRTGS